VARAQSAAWLWSNAGTHGNQWRMLPRKMTAARTLPQMTDDLRLRNSLSRSDEASSGAATP